MKKKILSIVIVSILLLASLAVFSAAGTRLVTSNDNLDQYQNEMDGGSGFSNGTCKFVQSFRPSYDHLTRIKLFIQRDGFPQDITLSVQTSRESGIIDSLSISADDIPDINVGLETEPTFFVFLESLKLNIGQKYYIVLNIPNANRDNYIMMYGADYWEEDHWELKDFYPRGEGLMYTSYSGWYETPDWAFATYGTGQKNQKPNTPTIEGSKEIKQHDYARYYFTCTDPENSDLKYFIDWGDGTNSGWLKDPVKSGQETYKDHYFGIKQKNIEIKVKTKDMFDEESNWGTLSVTMPKSKAVTFRSFKLLENFPILLRVIQMLL